MSDPSALQTTILTELRQLKTLLEEISASLQSQREILKVRNITLPPMTFSTLNSLVTELDKLDKKVINEQTEIGQLRSLADNAAMINSTFDLDLVLSNAMEVVISLTQAERGYIILKNEISGEVEFRVKRENEVAQRGSAHSTAPQISMSVVNEVLNSGTPLLTDNAYKDERWQGNASVAAFSLRSVLCVPLKYKDEVLGAVYVDNRIRAGVFEQRERNLLTAFANQVAVAIANARLFQRIQTSLQEILQMKELTDNVFASIGSGVITTDANNLITTFNQAACQILEKEHDAVIGQPLNQVLEVAADLDEILQQAQQESNLIIETEFSVSKNRRVVANMKFSPLRDANLNTQGVAIVLDDLTQQRERDEMLNVMQRYLPPALIENIHSIAGLDLGGERREVTCIFAEAGSVGTFAKGLPPQQIMEMVNAYLATATEAIHTVQGVIDKYMGTDVMALFNSQLNPMEDHAARAVEAALLMREGFIQLYRKLGIDPNPHYYRIGVHTGVATLGNVGSIIRRDFTAIGDTINLSKRLQENAKYGQIIISEDTRQLLQNAPIRLVELEPLQVKGRQQHTRVYEIFRV